MWSYTGCCCGHAPADPVPYWPQPIPQYSPWCQVAAKDISASTAANSAQATVAGVGSAFLSLQYLKDAGAPESSITLTITDSSGTGEWNITTLLDGFQEKGDFAVATPGATVKLDVTGCTAQLSWFERTY